MTSVHVSNRTRKTLPLLPVSQWTTPPPAYNPIELLMTGPCLCCPSPNSTGQCNTDPCRAVHVINITANLANLNTETKLRICCCYETFLHIVKWITNSMERSPSWRANSHSAALLPNKNNLQLDPMMNHKCPVTPNFCKIHLNIIFQIMPNSRKRCVRNTVCISPPFVPYISTGLSLLTQWL